MRLDLADGRVTSKGGIGTDTITAKAAAVGDVSMSLGGKFMYIESGTDNVYTFNSNNHFVVGSKNSNVNQNRAGIEIHDSEYPEMIFSMDADASAASTVALRRVGSSFYINAQAVGDDIKIATGNAVRLTVSDADIAAFSGYTPQTDNSLATKSYVDSNAGGGDLPISSADETVTLASLAQKSFSIQVGDKGNLSSQLTVDQVAIRIKQGSANSIIVTAIPEEPNSWLRFNGSSAAGFFGYEQATEKFRILNETATGSAFEFETNTGNLNVTGQVQTNTVCGLADNDASITLGTNLSFISAGIFNFQFENADGTQGSKINVGYNETSGTGFANVGVGGCYLYLRDSKRLGIGATGINFNANAASNAGTYDWTMEPDGTLVGNASRGIEASYITAGRNNAGGSLATSPKVEFTGVSVLLQNVDGSTFEPTEDDSLVTKGWVSANAGGGTGSETLEGLTDTDINSPVSDQFLVFRGGKWTNVSSTSGVPIIPPGENAGIEWDDFQWPTAYASNMFKVGLDGIFTDGVYYSTNGILWQQAPSTVTNLLQADSSQIHKSTSESNWYMNDEGTAYSNDMRNWFRIDSLTSSTSNGTRYGNVFCFNGEFYLIARERVTNNQGVPFTWKFLQYSRFYNQWLDPEDSTISDNIYAWLNTQDAQASVSYAPWWTDSQGVSGNYVLGLLIAGTVISLDPVTAEVKPVANLTGVRSLRYGGEKFVAQFDTGTKSIATSENPITSDWGTLAMYPKAGPYEVPEYDGIGRWHIIPADQDRLLYLYADDRENMVWIQNINIGPKATKGNNYLTGANGRVILGSVYDGNVNSPDYTISQTYYISGIDIGAGNYEADSKVLSLEKKILKLEALIKEKCS